jgi:hypothetical protein
MHEEARSRAFVVLVPGYDLTNVAMGVRTSDHPS